MLKAALVENSAHTVVAFVFNLVCFISAYACIVWCETRVEQSIICLSRSITILHFPLSFAIILPGVFTIPSSCAAFPAAPEFIVPESNPLRYLSSIKTNLTNARLMQDALPSRVKVMAYAFEANELHRNLWHTLQFLYKIYLKFLAWRFHQCIFKRLIVAQEDMYVLGASSDLVARELNNYPKLSDKPLQRATVIIVDRVTILVKVNSWGGISQHCRQWIL